MKKPIVLAALAVGAYLLWKKSQGAVNGIGESPYSDLSGLGRFSVRRAVSAVTSSVTAPLAVAVTPLRVAAAPMTSAGSIVKVLASGGSIADANRAGLVTIKREVMTPLTVPVKALQPILTKDLSQKLSNLGSKPGIRVALGRPKPGSNTPTAIVSGASMGPTVADGATWSSVPGKSGWEYCIASDGSTVFRNLSTNSSFYCTSSDMSQIGTLDGAVNLFLYGNTYGPGGAPGGNSAPDTQTMPGTPGSTFVPSTSNQSYSSGQQTTYGGGGGGGGQSFTADPGYYPSSTPSSTTSEVTQQYQPADTVAPAAAGKMNPLVVAGTLIAVPLAFMLTGKK